MFWRKKSIPQAPVTPPRPIAPYRFGYSLEYFRNREDLVAETRTLLKTPHFQAVMSVLQHEIPLNSTIEAVFAHRRVLRLIELMAEAPPVDGAEVPITFGAEKEFPELSEPQPTE